MTPTETVIEVPSPDFTIAIADFHAVTPSAINDTSAVSHRVLQSLRRRLASEPGIAVVHLSDQVQARTEDEAIVTVQRVCSAAARHIDLVIWGEIRRDESELLIAPRVTWCHMAEPFQAEERLRNPFVATAPSHLTFKQRVSSEIVDVATAAVALERYRRGEFQSALLMLRKCPIEECAFMEAVVELELASAGGDESIERIDRATDILGRLAGNVSTVSIRDIHTMQARALVLASRNSDSQDAVAALESAKDLLSGLTGEETEDWNPSISDARNQLGIVLWELGRRLDDPRASFTLEAAEEEFRIAIARLPDLPWESGRRAVLKTNLGLVLVDIARRSGEIMDLKEAERMLFSGLSSVQEDERRCLGWGRTARALGIVYRELARREQGDAAIGLLRRASLTDGDVLEVCPHNLYPRDWFSAANNAAVTKLLYADELENLETETESAYEVASEAVQLLESVLGSRDRETEARDWGRAAVTLGDALLRLSSMSNSSKGRDELLRRAEQLEREGVEVLTRVGTPREISQARMNLALVLAELAPIEGSPSDIKLFREAVALAGQSAGDFSSASSIHLWGQLSLYYSEVLRKAANYFGRTEQAESWALEASDLLAEVMERIPEGDLPSIAQYELALVTASRASLAEGNRRLRELATERCAAARAMEVVKKSTRRDRALQESCNSLGAL